MRALRCVPRCSTMPSRSNVASCARTALSVISRAWANSSTVRGARRNRDRHRAKHRAGRSGGPGRGRRHSGGRFPPHQRSPHHAAGDVARFYDPTLQTRRRVEHEDNANTMGRLAGRVMAGQAAPLQHLPFFYSDLFEFGYEAVGEVDARLETVADWREPYHEGVILLPARGAGAWRPVVERLGPGGGGPAPAGRARSGAARRSQGASTRGLTSSSVLARAAGGRAAYI